MSLNSPYCISCWSMQGRALLFPISLPACRRPGLAFEIYSHFSTVDYRFVVYGMCRVNGSLHCIWLLNLLLISCVRTDSQRAERERITQPDPVPRPGGLDGPSNKFFFYFRQGSYDFAFVCQQDNSKSYRRILVKFIGGVGCVARKTSFYILVLIRIRMGM